MSGIKAKEDSYSALKVADGRAAPSVRDVGVVSEV